MTQVSVHEAKTNLSRLIASALDGEEVVIARGNIPVVRLVPVSPAGERKFGALKGAISVDDAFFAPLPAEELSGWNVD